MGQMALSNVVWSQEVRPCPCCGAASFLALGRRGGTAHHAGRGVETTVVRCRGCHAVYPRPFLSPDRNPYEDHSAHEYFRSGNAQAKREAGRLLAKQAAALGGRTGRLLEIGCGRGELLSGAREVGWTVAGIDATAWDDAEPDIPVENARAEVAESLNAKGRYDAVLLAAILEHVEDPVALLSRVKHALAPGGLVFIDVPNECSLWTRVGNGYLRARGRDWVLNLSPTFPPYHVVGFCPHSLRLLLRKVGFDVITLKTSAWKNELPKRPGWSARLESGVTDLVLRVGPWIGMGAGIVCWARRAADSASSSIEPVLPQPQL